MDLLDKMGTFVRVVEAGSLSAAAKQLRLSPAAVSRQIATLERETRAPLLSRTTRSMSVTAAGRDYYERCVRILRDVEDAHATLRGDPLDGPLSVSVPLTFGTARVVPHLGILRKRHPRLRLDLHLEDRIVDPVSENVDLLVRVGGTPPDSLVAHSLLTFGRLLVASPAYLRARGEPKTPEALAKHDALSRPGAGTGTLPSGMNVVFRTNSLFALRQLALAGDGIALLPDWLVEREIAERKLRIVLPGWYTERTTAYALHRIEQRGAPRIRAFLGFLRDVLS